MREEANCLSPGAVTQDDTCFITLRDPGGPGGRGDAEVCASPGRETGGILLHSGLYPSVWSGHTSAQIS